VKASIVASPPTTKVARTKVEAIEVVEVAPIAKVFGTQAEAPRLVLILVRKIGEEKAVDLISYEHEPVIDPNP